MALDFPLSSASPFTAPNGVVYTWNAAGYWEAKADPINFDSDYLKLDATNGPVTGDLKFEQLTAHEGGVKISGGGTNVEAGSGLIKYESGLLQISGGTKCPLILGDDTWTFGIRTRLQEVTGAGGYYYAFVSDTSPAGGTFDILNLYRAVPTNINNATINRFVSFSSPSVDSNVAKEVYAFKAGIKTDAGTSKSYNFYASGDAPNYFAGDITCDGKIKTGGGLTVNGGQLSYYGFSGVQFTSRPGIELPTAPYTTNGIWGNQNTLVAIGNSNAGAVFANTSTSNWTTVVNFRNGSSANCGSIECKKDTLPRFSAPSDRRLKSNIVDAESMLPKFEALQVRRYTIDSGDGPTDNVLGFIADELQQVFADAVEGEPNAMVTRGNVLTAEGYVIDKDIEDPATSGYTLEEGQTFASTRTSVPKYQAVAPSALIIPMAKAIQELIALNTALTTRVEQLESTD